MQTARLSILLAACVLIAGMASAQTPVPSPTPASTRLAFDHDGVNTDGYKLAIDGGVSTVVVAACAVVASVRTCDVPFPALTPGAHSLVVLAFNAAGEAASDPFAVVMFVQPAKAVNLRIVVK
jgi:hypothetical protein